jgi:hypothetical protein
VDRFSKYAWVIARSSKDSKGTTVAFKKICEDFRRLTGVYPYAVLHDSGLEFRNKTFSAYCKKIHCKQHLTEPYRPATMIERFNRSLRENVDRFLHMYKTERYLDYLPKFAKQYRTHVHRATGETPHDLLTDKTLWRAAAKKIKAAGERRVQKSTTTLKVGDNVRISLLKEKQAIGHVGPADQWSKRVYIIQKVLRSRGAPKFRLKDHPHPMYANRLQKVAPVQRRVRYSDRPRLSPDDPERKARTGLFGSVAARPVKKKKRPYKRKGPVQKNTLSAYFRTP